jgi:hypothetical protein
VLLARQTDQALECFLFFLAFAFGLLVDSILFAFSLALLALLLAPNTLFLAMKGRSDGSSNCPYCALRTS